MPSKSENQIVVVTGLPRSGTSMMMKMLEAGGIAPLCDGERTADSDNPNGYYEYEPVKKTQEDPGWLQNAAGCAVKMVYSLLYDLPADRVYDVLFMRRDLNEILASQRRMLMNMELASTVDDDRMFRLFTGEIVRFQNWIKQSDHINCLEVPYNDVASGRVEPIRAVNTHLGNYLDTDAMSAVVDPSLYRNRVA